jgi:hypothetical protein
MAWAIEQQDVRDAHARHVLLCLANYADNNGKAAFPSTATLVEDTGMSESTIRRKLDQLEQAGLIVKGNQAVVAAYIARGDRRPVCYDMSMKKRGVAVTGRDSRGVTEMVTGCQPESNGVSNEGSRGVTVTPNPSLTVLEPSLNQKHTAAARPAGTRKNAPAKTSIPENFAVSDRVAAWAEENGHTQIEVHLASFIGKCKAKGYVYASWDDAFMEAIRADWAGLTKVRNHAAAGRNDRSAAAAAIFPQLSKHSEVIDV